MPIVMRAWYYIGPLLGISQDGCLARFLKGVRDFGMLKASVSIDGHGFFFRGGGGKTDPLECRKIFSGGKVGGPGSK